MNAIEWRIEGPEFSACSCNIGCPCQFGARPTQEHCHAVVCGQIDRGYFGASSLNGLRWAAAFAWPHAIHEGNGEVEVYIDERADSAQREALLAILSGQHSAPGATIFEVFSHTYRQVHPPVFAAIELDIDVSGRRANLRIDDLMASEGEPLRNPVTGDEFRACLQLPAGFEYSEAEFGRSRFVSKGKVRIAGEGCHGHFTRLNMTGQGVIH